MNLNKIDFRNKLVIENFIHDLKNGQNTTNKTDEKTSRINIRGQNQN